MVDKPRCQRTTNPHDKDSDSCRTVYSFRIVTYSDDQILKSDVNTQALQIFNFLAYKCRRESWEEKETVRNKNRTVSVENTSPDKKKGRRENKRENWVLRYCWDKNTCKQFPGPSGTGCQRHRYRQEMGLAEQLWHSHKRRELVLLHAKLFLTEELSSGTSGRGSCEGFLNLGNQNVSWWSVAIRVGVRS